MSIKTKKIAFYISFILSLLIALIRCDRGVPTETVGSYSISGFVNRDDTPVDSLEVKLAGDIELSTTTDSLGKYVFEDLAEGLYAISPTLSGYEFNPNKLQVELAGASLESQNFIMRELSPSLLLLKTALDFGEVSVGSVSQLELRISNLGNGELSLSKFSFSSKLFTASVSELVIQPKALESLQVSFAPLDSPAVNEQLTITTNDPNQQTAVVTLSGKGVFREKPTMVLDQELLDFGYVSLEASGIKNLTISNEGEDVLSISSISTTSTLFEVTPGTAQVPGGEKQIIKVTFTPVEAIPVTATLNIENNSSNQPSASVALQGSSSSGTSITPSVAVSATALDFGQVFVDSTAVLELIISNVGLDTLHLNGLEIDNSSFSTPFSPTALAPTENVSYTVSFSGSSRGIYQGEMLFYTDDPDNSYLRIPLQAEVGTPPPTEIRINPSQIAFGTVTIGFEYNGIFWVVNPNYVPLIVSSISSSLPGEFRVDKDSLEIDPGDSAKVTVTFAPSAAVPYSGDVVLNTNVLSFETVTVALTGEGGALPDPSMELSVTSMDFGSVVLGDNVTSSLSIVSKGPGTLNIAGMEIDNTVFSVEYFTGEIKAGSTKNIQVIFQPKVTGLASGTLVINSNDPAQSRVEISLAGAALDTAALAPAMAISTHTLNMGTVLLQTTSSSTVIIGNIGKKDLIVTDISSSNPVFSVDLGPFSLSPGMEQEMRVNFSPASESPIQGFIVIESNDLVRPVDTVQVEGAGLSGSGVVTEQEMYVPGGNFLMGYGGDETVRQVTLTGFYADVYEVTNAEYKEFMDAGGYDNSTYWTSEGWAWRKTSKDYGFDPDNPRPRFWGTGDVPWENDPCSNMPNSPVVGVSWYEAYAYARFRDKSLPTEAQWEYIARASTKRIYPWGDSWDGSLLNHGKSRSPFYDGTDGFASCAPVGSYPEGTTPEGFFDLSGNVWEWCLDFYGQYDVNDIFNPQGPAQGSAKIIRGGSWYGSTDYCRLFDRNRSEPFIRYRDGGIRLVRN
jgi:formylglycine-generating enzyme required for sulfatase activity